MSVEHGSMCTPCLSRPGELGRQVESLAARLAMQDHRPSSSPPADENVRLGSNVMDQGLAALLGVASPDHV
jgi:hypothetical protein